MFAPPFRDPFNYYQHPYAIAGIDVVGAMMLERFLMEGKPGVTQRRGAPYSTWFNGGLRTTAHFHNMIGILTETIGSPDPISIPFIDEQADRRLEPVDADQAADGVAHAPVDRVLDDRQPRDPRLRLALPREGALQHLPDGPRRDSVGQRGPLDVHAARDGARAGRAGREGRRSRRARFPARRRPARPAAAGAAAVAAAVAAAGAAAAPTRSTRR